MIRVLTVRSKRLLSFLFEKICNVAAVFEKQKSNSLVFVCSNNIELKNKTKPIKPP